MSNLKKNITLQNIQYILIIILALTLPYHIVAPLFSIFLSSVILIISVVCKKIVINELLKERTILYLYTFIIILYLSALWSPANNIFGGNFKVTIYGYLNYFILIPAIYFSTLSNERIKILFSFIILSPLFYIILYYTNFFNLTHIYSYSYDTINGNYKLYVDLFANIFLLFSSIFLYIKILKSYSVKSYKQAFYFFCLFSIVSISLFIDGVTVSRLINITFLISIIFISSIILRGNKRLFALLTIGLLSVFYLASSNEYKKGEIELVHIYTQKTHEGSWGHRAKLAEYGLNMWLENPYFGRGATDIIDQMKLAREANPQDFHDNTIHFHNQHILILVQSGVFGYILFLLFLYNFYSLKINDNEIYLYKQAVIVIFFVIMNGEHYLETIHTSSLFALFIALFLLYKKQEKLIELTKSNNQ